MPGGGGGGGGGGRWRCGGGGDSPLVDRTRPRPPGQPAGGGDASDPEREGHRRAGAAPGTESHNRRGGWGASWVAARTVRRRSQQAAAPINSSPRRPSMATSVLGNGAVAASPALPASTDWGSCPVPGWRPWPGLVGDTSTDWGKEGLAVEDTPEVGYWPVVGISVGVPVVGIPVLDTPVVGVPAVTPVAGGTVVTVGGLTGILVEAAAPV